MKQYFTDAFGLVKSLMQNSISLCTVEAKEKKVPSLFLLGLRFLLLLPQLRCSGNDEDDADDDASEFHDPRILPQKVGEHLGQVVAGNGENDFYTSEISTSFPSFLEGWNVTKFCAFSSVPWTHNGLWGTGILSALAFLYQSLVKETKDLTSYLGIWYRYILPCLKLRKKD